MNKKKTTVILAFSILLCLPQTVCAQIYVPGQSLVAEDQEKASNGLRFPGLKIIWLDLGDDIVTSYSDMPNQYSDGMARIQKARPLINWKPGQLAAPPGFYSGYIDRTGKEVIPLGQLEEIDSEFHEGFAVSLRIGSESIHSNAQSVRSRSDSVQLEY